MRPQSHAARGVLWMLGAVFSFAAMAVAARALVHLAGQFCWMYAIGALALATVFAIEFTMPVWTALLAALFLHEHLNRARAVQLALGIAGVIVILRPGYGAFHPAAL